MTKSQPTIMLTRRVRRGLTLIELVIVIAILGLLATFVGGQVFGTFSDSQAEMTKLTMQRMESALTIYATKNRGKYPSSLDDAKKYMPDGKVPKDSWDNEFGYKSPSSCSKPYEITSMGEDGKAGGEDDISSCESQ